MGAGGSNPDAEAAAAMEKPAAAIPTSQMTIDVKLKPDEMRPHIIALCKDILDRWSSIDDSLFSIGTVTGGITNSLLKVTVRKPDGNDQSVTVRLYGPNTDLIIDRKRELQAIPYLSAAEFGAELLGIFKNGVVQSFINGRTLKPPDIRDRKIAARIAKELRRFHQVNVPGPREPQLWIDIFKFLHQATSLKFRDSTKHARYETISFEEIREEVNKLKDFSEQLSAPVVYAHNDLLSGNLMLNELEGKLYLIDFEYGSYGYRGYDIANHFNEYAGFDCDYNLYPDKDTQYHFFRNYLQPGNPDEVADEDLLALYVETNTYRLASHMYWALWALIQASQESTIDFDYFQYFFLRFDEYKRQKEACFSLAKSYLSGSRSDSTK